MEQSISQLGAYRIYDRIGGGGFAAVYLARDTRNNEVVAVKVLHPHLAHDPQFITRFQREAVALKALPLHPSIVHLRDFGVQDGNYYLVMEYLEGKDLSQLLAERKRLPVDEALSITVQIAQALNVAHQYGLIHRDIKPGNIKVMPQGIVKVMDFGIVRAAEGSQITQAGTFMGVPEYIAPELWEGRPADIRSDIYALGVVFYEMVTGITPFHGETLAATMRKHLTERPRPAREICDVPANVEKMIDKMMARKPDARYKDPAELLTAMGIEAEQFEKRMVEVKQPLPKKHGSILAPLFASIVGFAVIIAVMTVSYAASIKAIAIPATFGMTPTITVEPKSSSGASLFSSVPISPTIALSVPPFSKISGIDGAYMVFVPGGEFVMGSSDGAEDEKPPHTVQLDAFWIDQYEVTNGLYKKCVDAGRCRPPITNSSSARSAYYGNPQFNLYPVINITWDSANTFCSWAGKRLPTEAEWEKAARGKTPQVYPWGDTFDRTKLNSSEANFQDREFDTSKVDRYPIGASVFGALDMAGNVWEWVQDWYDSTYYRNSPQFTPFGPLTGQTKVKRGGSWSDDRSNARTTHREAQNPLTTSDKLGFRCAQ